MLKWGFRVTVRTRRSRTRFGSHRALRRSHGESVVQVELLGGAAGGAHLRVGQRLAARRRDELAVEVAADDKHLFVRGPQLLHHLERALEAVVRRLAQVELVQAVVEPRLRVHPAAARDHSRREREEHPLAEELHRRDAERLAIEEERAE